MDLSCSPVSPAARDTGLSSVTGAVLHVCPFVNEEMNAFMLCKFLMTKRAKASWLRKQHNVDPSHLRTTPMHRNVPKARLPPAAKNVVSDVEEESCTRKKKKKNKVRIRSQWLIPVVLATQEAEMRRIKV
jgi:hypothetical protein